MIDSIVTALVGFVFAYGVFILIDKIDWKYVKMWFKWFM